MTLELFSLAALGPTWVGPFLQAIFIIVCVLMVLVVLIQKPQGGGLAGAFGGSSAGSGQTAFGTKTGDALTVFTVSVFVIFVVVAILLNLALKAPSAKPADITPAATETPAAPATDTTNPATTPATSDTILPTQLPEGSLSPATNSAGELPATVTTPTVPATDPATPPPAPEEPKP